MVVRLSTDGPETIPIQQTEFFEAVAEDVYGPRQGGAIIFLDAENARKGVAKTTAAITLARLFANAFDYGLKKDDFVIAGPDYITRYRDQPGKEQPSVLLADELVGGGAGDARRSMSSSNIKIGRAFQLLRKKRVVTIATLPDWGDADTRLQKQAAYRVHALEDPIGTFKAYKITVPFDGRGGPHTKGLGPGDTTRKINFPDLGSRGDPYFEHLEELKDELLDQQDFDAAELQEDDEDDEQRASEDDIRREERIETAIRLYEPWDDDNAQTYADVARAIPDYGKKWVGSVIRDWQRGDYRDLVADPTK